MKIDGQSISAKARKTVPIPKPGKKIEVEIEAYPFGLAVETLLPYPAVPVTGIRLRGGKVARDDNGQAILIKDENDKEYVERTDRLFWLRMAALFYYAVKPVGRIVFESVSDCDHEQEIRNNPEGFFSKIFNELREIGFSGGDVNIVVAATRELSNMSDTAVEDYEADFSQGEKSPQENSQKSGQSSTQCAEQSNVSD